MARARDINDATVKLKTGRASIAWSALLDSFNSPPKGHTAMAKFLREEHKVSPWWAQIITNRYEWKKGLRKS